MRSLGPSPGRTRTRTRARARTRTRPRPSKIRIRIRIRIRRPRTRRRNRNLWMKMKETYYSSNSGLYLAWVLSLSYQFLINFKNMHVLKIWFCLWNWLRKDLNHCKQPLLIKIFIEYYGPIAGVYPNNFIFNFNNLDVLTKINKIEIEIILKFSCTLSKYIIQTHNAKMTYYLKNKGYSI